MKIFISWSGPRSRHVARGLKQLLGDVIQAVTPFMSETDVEVGSRWADGLKSELQTTDVGILCLTQENLSAPWILFEAGALLTAVSEGKVFPYLIDVSPADVRWPLAQFQSKPADFEGTWAIVNTLNEHLERALPIEQLRRLFARSWPDMEMTLKEMPDPDVVPQQRPIEEILEELVILVRSMRNRELDHVKRKYLSAAFAMQQLKNAAEHALDPGSLDALLNDVRSHVIGLRDEYEDGGKDPFLSISREAEQFDEDANEIVSEAPDVRFPEQSSTPPQDFLKRLKSHGAVLTEDFVSHTIEFGPDGFPETALYMPLGQPNETLHFGNPYLEYLGATTEAAVFDLFHRGHLEVIGSDRQKFLNGFCTADVTNLKFGEGCEAFMTNSRGKVLGHVFGFIDAESVWLETVSESVPAIMDHLRRYVISEDVDFLPRGESVAELYLSGPTAKVKLGDLGLDVSGLPLYGHFHGTLGGHPVHARRLDWLKAPGYQLCIPQESLSSFWELLVDAGVRPAGMAVFHALRIEAGLPLYGIDITDDNLAQEVGRTEQGINFNKGLYLGQETIARIATMGHVRRELRTLRFDSAAFPFTDAIVSDSTGNDIGRVTSCAILPEYQFAVALAYLQRTHLNRGTRVIVDCEGGMVEAHVA